MLDRLSTTRGLLAYGLAVALIACFALALLVPEGDISISRAGDLRASAAAMDRGAPLLVALKHDAYSPAGATDDQGIYVFLPPFSEALGLDDPVDGMKWLWLVCAFVPLALYPLIFRLLFGNIAAALVAPWALALAIASFGHSDIYWIQPWAPVALLPPLLLVLEARPRASVAIVAGCCLGASFASSIRAQAGLPVLIAAIAVVVLMRDWSLGRRAAAVVLALVCYLAIQPIGMAGVRAYRDDWVDDPNFAKGVPTGHPLWHNTYIGLGYLPNRWKIQWSDTVAAESVERVRPGTIYVSPEYESILRRLYFNVWKEDPGYVVGVTAQKASAVLRHSAIYLGFLLLTVPWILLVSAERARFRRWLLLFLPGLLIALLNPLVSVPYRSYELGVYGIFAVVALLVIAALAEPVLRRPRELLGSLATGPGRRAAVISGVALALLVVNFVGAASIQNRAVDWAAKPIEQGPLP